ncbi:MAG: helix-turn-helix domain-containing protein, partial [Pirellulales bacterium]
MPTTPTLAYLDIQAVAEQLGVDYPDAKRLIARRTLKAVQLGGADGPWKIATDTLNAYIAAGAPDLRNPDLAGDWFENQTHNASRFEDQVMAAMELQLPTEHADLV